ncbi:nucleotidyl transferase AbiEii/AbiGii toxin family protein [Candidatus Poriferisodalis sp.]|uniref:nucleotidyl transferase AbiEii/AbiGii toxin family protein n=1 Tax=Candidatus Poriferisodalis sp. TaxID=3101277 RepID=UPI003B013643
MLKDGAAQWAFGGGTSLTTAWGIVRRYSEDIDGVLLVAAADAQHRNLQRATCSQVAKWATDDQDISAPAPDGNRVLTSHFAVGEVTRYIKFETSIIETQDQGLVVPKEIRSLTSDCALVRPRRSRLRRCFPCRSAPQGRATAASTLGACRIGHLAAQCSCRGRGRKRLTCGFEIRLAGLAETTYSAQFSDALTSGDEFARASLAASDRSRLLAAMDARLTAPLLPNGLKRSENRR